MRRLGIAMLACIASGVTVVSVGADGVRAADPLGAVRIDGPAGSGEFGDEVVPLDNGNFVVVDELYDDGALADVGAVWVYSGTTSQLVAGVIGSASGDMVGSGGVVPVGSGFVVSSPSWSDGAMPRVGAATWVDATAPASIRVSTANSLVGSQADDRVSSGGVAEVGDGNYVVLSPDWSDAEVASVGAATWRAGGSAGATVSGANSLIGERTSDRVGSAITVLANGNFVVASGAFDASPVRTDAGATTFGSGALGLPIGGVSAVNSLVGQVANDRVGAAGVVALTNGNYAVPIPAWDLNILVPDVGAVFVGNGAATVGAVDAAMSVRGSSAFDGAGIGATALSDGSMVVAAPGLDNNLLMIDVGAVIWRPGRQRHRCRLTRPTASSEPCRTIPSDRAA